jgi:hypothetical protein
MVNTRRLGKPGKPGDVVALSPFRAELGRGRRLRRAEALYEARDLGEAVRALPGDELYYVLHEVGLAEGADLLARATPEQLQVALDFALWERDRIAEAPLGEWLEAMSTAPIEAVGRWLAGLDSELVALMIRRRARIYDLSQESAPDEPAGTLFATPDGLFAIDVRGRIRGDDGEDEATALVRLLDTLYRADAALARRILVGARAEMDSELEETAFRWRQGRMADLGFADYYEALEIYQELDPASVRLDEPAVDPPVEAAALSGDDDALRVPTALADRLRDTEGPLFARAAQMLNGPAVDALRVALIALTNRVLAADRVSPGDDDTVATTLERLAATLDLGLERLAGGDDDRAARALANVPLPRVFRLGYTLTSRVRALATALRREGPFGPAGVTLLEPDDTAVIEAVSRPRPLYPRPLDDPPKAGERPFAGLADVGRATAALEKAAVAQAMLRGLGVTPADLAPDSGLLRAVTDADETAVDAGVIARTVLVRRLVSSSATVVSALKPDEVRAFNVLVRPARSSRARLPPALEKRARSMLAAAAPPHLAHAASLVAARWLASLAPLETVLMSRHIAKPAAGQKPPRPAKRR